MIDTKQLEDLKVKARVATPGPWRVQGFLVDAPELIRHRDTYIAHLGVIGSILSNDQLERNADFIANANPTTVLSLIAELEQARKDAESRMQELISAQSEIGRLDAKLFLAEENAERYLALRNIHDEQLEIAGIPCIAVPQGPDMHGKRNGFMVNGADADKATDLLRSGKLVWKSDFDAALSAQEGEGKS